MNDKETRKALVDLAAFILYGLEKGKTDHFARSMDESDVLATVAHDVGGLLNGDEFFVPRSAGYSEEASIGADLLKS